MLCSQRLEHVYIFCAQPARARMIAFATHHQNTPVASHDWSAPCAARILPLSRKSRPNPLQLFSRPPSRHVHVSCALTLKRVSPQIFAQGQDSPHPCSVGKMLGAHSTLAQCATQREKRHLLSLCIFKSRCSSLPLYQQGL